MRSYVPGEILAAYRNWAGSIDELAVLATILTQGLGLEPDPSTAAKSHIAPRTVRYYITQGLLSPAEGQTRNAVYTYRHLLELLFIKCMQSKGATLDDIRESIRGRELPGLESSLLEEMPEQTSLPLPSDPELFDKYHWSTVWDYWTRTAPYAWREFLVQEESGDTGGRGGVKGACDAQAVADAREAGGVRETRARESASTSEALPSEAPPMRAEEPPGLEEVPHTSAPRARYETMYSRRVGRPGEDRITRFVRIDVADGVQLTVPEDHQLAQNKVYRQELVARLRRWLR